MSDIFDVFGLQSGPAPRSRYLRIGLPRNPFREPTDPAAYDSTPLYSGHIQEELGQIQTWLREVHLGQTRLPLSVVGSIGLGKTHILRQLRQAIVGWPPAERASVQVELLSDAGYARASIGGLLVAALERLQLPWWNSEPAPGTGILPIIWCIVRSKKFVDDVSTPLRRALTTARNASGGDREHLMQLLSRWIQRAPLTPAQANKLGLHRRIDWEGEVIGVVADLLRFARSLDVIHTFFLFIDQLEEIFRPTFSALRRSRLLTDLRGLVDEIDAGAPIGLLLAWDPSMKSELEASYAALYERLRRRPFITLRLMEEADALPFAKHWVSNLKDEPGFDRSKLKVQKWVDEAWESLRNQRKLQLGNKVTPRALLAALAERVDAAAGAAEAL